MGQILSRTRSRLHGSGHFIVGALTAGLFLAYLIALPPHLVHHFFDEDQGRTVCPLLAQSQETPGLQTDPLTLIPLSPTEIIHPSLSAASLPSPDLPVGRPRAPPVAPPSA